MLVKEKTTQDKNVISEKSTFSLILDLIKKGILRNVRKLSRSDNKSTFSMNIIKGISANKIQSINSDIINLHWISNEMISLKEISKIQKSLINEPTTQELKISEFKKIKKTIISSKDLLTKLDDYPAYYYEDSNYEFISEVEKNNILLERFLSKETRIKN